MNNPLVLIFQIFYNNNIYFDLRPIIFPHNEFLKKGGYMPKTDSQKSYQKALYLGLAFIVVLVIANYMVKFVSHATNPFRTHMGAAINANVMLFAEEEKGAVIKKIKGFWYCNSVKSVEFPFLTVSDRFELKDNGVFWQVRRDVVHLPSGDSVDFVTIMNGFMSPYSRSKTCADSISCQIHFFGQVLISGSDTCYTEHARMSDDPKKSVMPDILRSPKREEGQGAVDTVWDIVANGKMFCLEERSYSAYDTARGALHAFFPQGTTKLVGKISVSRCPNTVSLESHTKDALVRDFAATSVESRKAENILESVNVYYKAMFAKSLAKRVTVYGKGSMTIAFSVNMHGNVSEPKIVESKPVNMRLNNEMKKELLTWAFPVCASQKAPVKAVVSFTY
jgi:hypothetical protein